MNHVDAPRCVPTTFVSTNNRRLSTVVAVLPKPANILVQQAAARDVIRLLLGVRWCEAGTRRGHYNC